MLHSIATVCLSGTLPREAGGRGRRALRRRRDLRERSLYFDGSPGRRPASWRRTSASRSRSYPAVPRLRGRPRERRQRNLDRAERKFDLMAELGAVCCCLCSNVGPDTIADDEAAVDDLGRARRAGRAPRHPDRLRGARLGPARANLGHAWRIVEAGRPAEPGPDRRQLPHPLAGRRSVRAGRRSRASGSFFVQVADAPRLHMDVLHWSRHFRCFPGQGDLDVAGFLAAVCPAGYGGPVSLEVFNDEFRAASTRQTAARRPRGSLVSWRSRRGSGWQAAEAAGGAARRAPSTCSIPRRRRLRRARVHRVRRRRRRRRPAGHAGSSSLGFVAAGRHRSKDVTLYRQGESTCRERRARSLRHAFFLLHGPVGLRARASGVEDAVQALNRARLYRGAALRGPDRARTSS